MSKLDDVKKQAKKKDEEIYNLHMLVNNKTQ